MVRYYLDTSIWLDFVEDRNEPRFPKTELARELIRKIVRESSVIFISDSIFIELEIAGYSNHEFDAVTQAFRKQIVFLETRPRQYGKAKDLALKRNVPPGDSLHAIIARDNKAILVSHDAHFQKLKDITSAKTPRELI